MENLSGKQFDQYQIVAPLGEGGMAAVYRAEQTGKLKRTVAVKVLPQHLAQNPEFLKRFKQEAQILAQLQHPHILPIFDYGEAEGYTYLVMPLIDSGTLTSLIQGKPMPLERIREVILQVGDALDYAHTLGLVHRDIKPSNILLDKRGHCLLSDFGIAKIIQDSGAYSLATTGFIGTPMYVSPEQGQGAPVDRRSDIYSLGVVLYEMVTGQTPFRGETPVAVIFKHIYEPPPFPSELIPDLPVEIERIILKALAKAPADRYQAVMEMAQALRQAIPETQQDTPSLTSRAERKNEPGDFHVSIPTTPVSHAPLVDKKIVAPSTPAPVKNANPTRTSLILALSMLIGAIIFSLYSFRNVFLPDVSLNPSATSSATANILTLPPETATSQDQELLTCLENSLIHIPMEKQISLEAGAGERDLDIPLAEIQGNSPLGPLGIQLTRGGQPVGGISFLIIHEEDQLIAFTINAIFDGEACSEVTDFFNATSPTSGKTLSNWDALEFPLADSRYYVRFGWQGDHVRLIFQPIP